MIDCISFIELVWCCLWQLLMANPFS